MRRVFVTKSSFLVAQSPLDHVPPSPLQCKLEEALGVYAMIRGHQILTCTARKMTSGLGEWPGVACDYGFDVQQYAGQACEHEQYALRGE